MKIRIEYEYKLQYSNPFVANVYNADTGDYIGSKVSGLSYMHAREELLKELEDRTEKNLPPPEPEIIELIEIIK